MAIKTAEGRRSASAWETVTTLVAVDGSATHPLIVRLGVPRAPVRDLTDMVHALCQLHGNHPGVIDVASDRSAGRQFAEWLRDAAAGVASERALLTRLVATAGPLPSTPGQAMSEAAIVAQRHALAMLAHSDRQGCAMGTAVALVLDWRAIHALLAVAAERLGVTGAVSPFDAPPLPDGEELPPPFRRALAFGAQQLLAQHRGLWDLLEARASAREAR